VARAERLWSEALERSEQAQAAGALVPLATQVWRGEGLAPFQLRRLQSATPKHLRAGGPKPNPFLPWDPRLEVRPLGRSHLVLLNKYPVQRGHLLLITQQWQPQSGWLTRPDWQAVATVAADTGGLWFFNSAPAAGASQPHRHLQLLPRHAGEPSCPLDTALADQLARHHRPWPWAYALSSRDRQLGGAAELENLYQRHAAALGLGSMGHDPQPRHPYNLLFCDDWFLMVRRRKEHQAGFSINALGFAGYLLATEHSQLDWLEAQGPWRLLQEVAEPVP
jgi:ATP adenylyltransferase